ncbi:MAG: response regulator [Rhizobacter sp.]|nr:response regulator [Bacteriovorax sp.]
MHAIRELSNSYEMSKLAIDSMVDYAVYILDKKGMILSSNCGAKNLTGFQTNEIIGTHFARFYTMEDIARKHPEYELKQAKLLGRYEEEGIRVRKDGSQFWAHIIFNCLNDQEGNHIGYSKITRDLTSQKNHEEALKMAEISAIKTSKLKSQFIADISHEIRTPLGAILGFAEFLRKDDISHEDRLHYLDIILKNGKCLNRVINDVLDLSKIEAGRIDIEMSDFKLNDMIEEVVELFRVQCLAKTISIRFIKNPEIDVVTTDTNRLRQILNNLISNAVKFTFKGEICISAEKLNENKESNNYRIVIQDTGMGLKDEEVVKIFQPFVQAGITNHKTGTGSGLGLVLSRKIAEALGGDVELMQTKAGVGSVFGIRFTDYKRLRSQSKPRVAEAIPGSLHSKSILIVDDSEDNLEIIKLFLNSYGGEADVASCGTEAIEKMYMKKYDIVLMDIEMPQMNGFQVIKELRNLKFKTPVVALTAHAMAEDKQKTKKAGFFEHVTKPIDFNYLVSVIERS